MPPWEDPKGGLSPRVPPKSTPMRMNNFFYEHVCYDKCICSKADMPAFEQLYLWYKKLPYNCQFTRTKKSCQRNIGIGKWLVALRFTSWSLPFHASGNTIMESRLELFGQRLVIFLVNPVLFQKFGVRLPCADIGYHKNSVLYRKHTKRQQKGLPDYCWASKERMVYWLILIA